MNLVAEYFYPVVWYASDFSDFAQSIAEQLDGFGTLEDATWHTHLPRSSMICVGPRFTRSGTLSWEATPAGKGDDHAITVLLDNGRGFYLDPNVSIIIYRFYLSF